jgi:hypothetical protein
MLVVAIYERFEVSDSTKHCKQLGKGKRELFF